MEPQSKDKDWAGLPPPFLYLSISCLAPKVKKGCDVIETGKKQTAKERYDKAKTKMYTIKVFKNTELDIIEKLDSVPNKAGYIKKLIRDDILTGK